VGLEWNGAFDRSSVGLGCLDRRDGSGLLFENDDWGALGRRCCRGLVTETAPDLNMGCLEMVSHCSVVTQSVRRYSGGSGF
jgi:hypothetical protein